MVKMVNIKCFKKSQMSSWRIQTWWAHGWTSKGLGSRWRDATGNNLKCMWKKKNVWPWAPGADACTSQQRIKWYQCSNSRVNTLPPPPAKMLGVYQDPLASCHGHRVCLMDTDTLLGQKREVRKKSKLLNILPKKAKTTKTSVIPQ